jgi:shikimate kinase
MPLASGELLALTGMMGAGKSTVARLLGARLERQVVSTDGMVEARFGKAIPRIFAEDGEPAFRAAERAIIDRLMGPLVVDLGGGAFCDPHSAERLLQQGRVVFLDISSGEAARRLAGGRGRPLAANWTTLRAERLASYRRASLTVAVDGLDSAEVVNRILEAL